MEKILQILIDRIVKDPKLVERILEKLLTNPKLWEKLEQFLLSKLLKGSDVTSDSSTDEVQKDDVKSEEDTSKFFYETWVEEMWHDWFQGEHPETPESDWLPEGHPRLKKILSGQEHVPPGASIFFFAGERSADGGPAAVPGKGIINHIFTFRGQKFVIPSDTQEGAQRWPDLGRVQYGQRGWKNNEGWAFVLRLRNPGTNTWGELTYQVEQNGKLSNIVKLTVANAG